MLSTRRICGIAYAAFWRKGLDLRDREAAVLNIFSSLLAVEYGRPSTVVVIGLPHESLPIVYTGMSRKRCSLKQLCAILQNIGLGESSNN